MQKDNKVHFRYKNCIETKQLTFINNQTFFASACRKSTLLSKTFINQNSSRTMIPGKLYEQRKEMEIKREKIKQALCRHKFIALLNELKVPKLTLLEQLKL